MGRPPAAIDTRTKFVTAAQKRMNKAIAAIRAVGKLDHMNGLNGDDVMVMSEALGLEVNAMRNRLVLASDREVDFQFGALDEDGEG